MDKEYELYEMKMRITLRNIENLLNLIEISVFVMKFCRKLEILVVG